MLKFHESVTLQLRYVKEQIMDITDSYITMDQSAGKI